MDPRPDPKPHEVRARAREIGSRIWPQAARLLPQLVGGTILAIVLGIGLRVSTGQSVLAGLVVLVVGLAAVASAWWWLRDPTTRAAWELEADHQCRENEAWKRDYGAPVPRGSRAQRAWLDAHPGAPGTASMLLALGELPAADQALDRMQPTNETERYELMILRATRQFLAGDPPDVDALHQAWADLVDPNARRDQRQCLATLEALVVARDGGDPIAVLADARRDVGAVAAGARAPRQVLKTAVPTIVAAVLVALVQPGQPT